MTFTIYSGSEGCVWKPMNQPCTNKTCRYTHYSKPICDTCLPMLKKMLYWCDGINAVHDAQQNAEQTAHRTTDAFVLSSIFTDKESIPKINIHRSLNDETTTPKTTSSMMTASGERLSFNGIKTRARVEVTK